MRTWRATKRPSVRFTYPPIHLSLRIYSVRTSRLKIKKNSPEDFMHKLEGLADQIRHSFDARTQARDRALAQARQLTRACSLAIRAVHRDESDVMSGHLAEARGLADDLRRDLAGHPD